MSRFPAAAVAIVITTITTLAAARIAAGDGATFEITKTLSGLCDASAAVGVSPTQFVVINDEDNLLRFFTVGSTSPSPDTIDLDDFLVTGDNNEADIEGAARIGDLVYWITSHGRNKVGKPQERRLRLFATRLTPTGAKPLTVEGAPYRDLLTKFIEPILKEQGFTADPGGKENPAKAPEMPGSLNIEGLAASGSSLLIGFRNPQPDVNGSPARSGRRTEKSRGADHRFAGGSGTRSGLPLDLAGAAFAVSKRCRTAADSSSLLARSTTKGRSLCIAGTALRRTSRCWCLASISRTSYRKRCSSIRRRQVQAAARR